MNRFTLEFPEILVPRKYLSVYYQSRINNAGFLLCLVTVMSFVFDIYDIVYAKVASGPPGRMDYFTSTALISDGTVMVVSIIFYYVIRHYKIHVRGVIAVACFVLSIPMIEVILANPDVFDSSQLL